MVFSDYRRFFLWEEKKSVLPEPDGGREVKARIPVWLYPSTLEAMDRAAETAGCRSRSEYLEKAALFYAGYVSGQDAAAYLPPALASVLRGTVQDTENRICRLLFKLTVELDMVINVLAAGMEIPWEQFRWYAAFHGEGTHPHVHMVCCSADGRSGYLDKKGIAKIKSGLAREIFRQELTEIYQKQTQCRDELVRKSGQLLRELIRQMRSGSLENPRIKLLMEELAKRLRNTSGKKQYGYLKSPVKAIVDESVDELARDSRVSSAYDLWYRLREEVLRTYRDDLPDRLPLSRQKEFKRIKNLVIEEAVRLEERSEFFQPSFIPEARVCGERPQSPSVISSATRLLHHMGNIFQEQIPAPVNGVSFVDKKLRQKIREKMAHGHKADDHEQAMCGEKICQKQNWRPQIGCGLAKSFQITDVFPAAHSLHVGTAYQEREDRKSVV